MAGRDPKRVTRSMATSDGLFTPVVDAQLKQKGGCMVLDSERGFPLSYENVEWLGESGLLAGKSYFYTIRVDCGCVDPIQHKGKVKIGMSATTVGGTPAFAYRISEYRRFYGDAAKLHQLVLFRSSNARGMAYNFESEIKTLTKRLIENGSNVSEDMLVPESKRKEWFMFSDLRPIMDLVRETREKAAWKEVFTVRRAKPRKDPSYRPGSRAPC